MTNNYELSYEEFLDVTNEISPTPTMHKLFNDWGLQMAKLTFTWFINEWCTFSSETTEQYSTL